MVQAREEMPLTIIKSEKKWKSKFGYRKKKIRVAKLSQKDSVEYQIHHSLFNL